MQLLQTLCRTELFSLCEGASFKCKGLSLEEWRKLYNEELYNVLPSPNQGGGDEQDM